MRKRDELADPKSCLNRARDDEWLFVLLGRDGAAPSTVEHWIAERIRLGLNEPGDQQILEAAAWVKRVTAQTNLTRAAVQDGASASIVRR